MTQVHAPPAREAQPSQAGPVRRPEAEVRTLPPALGLAPSRVAAGAGAPGGPPVRPAAPDGSGAPLEPSTRAAMEDRLGADLGDVRIHTGPAAEAAARGAGAFAFTVGRDVVLGGRSDGRRPEAGALLLHELVHAVQQSAAAPPAPGAPVPLDAPDSVAEREAAAIGAAHEAAPGLALPGGRPAVGPARARPSSIPPRQRLSRPVLARQAVPNPPQLADLPPGAQFEIGGVGEDPGVVLANMPDFLQRIATVRWDAETVRRGAPPPGIVTPTSAVICTQSHFIFLSRTGRVTGVTEQDVADPRMIERRVSLIVEAHTGKVWVVGSLADHIALQDIPVTTEPSPEAPAGQSQLLVFMPGTVLTPEFVSSLRRGLAARRAVGDGPEWAQDAVADARRRPHGRRPPAPTPPPASSTEPRDAPPAPPSPPLRGDPRLDLVTRGEQPAVQITLDRAVTTVPLHEGESDAALDQRIDAAIDALQASRDPSRQEGLAGGATRTGFVDRPGAQETGTAVSGAEATAQAQSSPGAATPGERLPGGRAANAPSYPATITMAGRTPDDDKPTTVPGATDAFTMTLDYAAFSFGLGDEVFNRLQPVQFYWELIDVTNVSVSEYRQRALSVAQGKGEAPGSEAGGRLSRELEAIAEDEQADLRMMDDQQWPWEARATYLTVIGLSNTVRVIGSLIESFVALLAEPLNERSLTFNRGGDFLVRCVATPLVDDEVREHPENHVIRASSVAVLPIRVQPLSTRALAAADSEEREIAAAEAQLREAEASGVAARIADKRAHLEELRRLRGQGGFDFFETQVTTARANLETALRLQRDLEGHVDPRQWAPGELELQLALRVRRTSVAEYIPLARAQVDALAGEHDANVAWARAQQAEFDPVSGVRDFRPRVAIASRETGQVSPLWLMLGRLPGSTERRHRWQLVDLTNAAAHERYAGESSLPGGPGDVAAIRDCFRNLAESGAYGRGTLALRFPSELATALGQTIDIESTMESRPGNHDRAIQRLKDLGKIAGLVGLVATGGLGVAVGVIGGVSGAIVSVDSLVHRAHTGHLLEPDTIFDVLGVIGGVAALGSAGTTVARGAASAELAAGRMPPWISRLERVEGALHIYGRIGAEVQLIQIGKGFLDRLDAIDRESATLSEGQRRARRALAFLDALDQGLVTIGQLSASFGAHGESVDLTAPGGERGVPPPIERTGPVADGSEPPVPPARSTRESGDSAALRAAAPSPDELVAQAEARAGRRLASAEDAAQAAARERAGAPEDLTDTRTAASTGAPGGPSRESPGTDVNAAQRARAVELLAGRLQGPRPAQARPPGEPPPLGPFGPRTTVADEAVASYDRAVAVAAGREAGLFYNPNTGEFAVTLGTEFEVSSPLGEGWVGVVHLHPNPENVIIRRLPAPMDVLGAVRAAMRTGRHVEFVESRRPTGEVGITRLEVTLNPRRIVVEMPAEPGEPARRIEVSSLDDYAREWGAETTYLDPRSELYRWVRRDLDAYYDAARTGSAHGAEGGRTAAGTAREPAAGRPGLTEGRPDIARRFEEADARATDAQRASGQLPSARFDAAMAALESSGLTPSGRRALADLFAPGPRGEPVSARRFEAGMAEVARLAELVQESQRLLTPEARAQRFTSLQAEGQRVADAYRRGETVAGTRLRGGAAPELAAAMRTMDDAFADYQRSASTDPVERLLAQDRLQSAVARAAETLRVWAEGFSETTRVGEQRTPSRLLRGVLEQPIDVLSRGPVEESLARDLPGVGLERYVLTPDELAGLSTTPPGLAGRLARLLRGYHRAHLVGPGFGGELFAGIMLAPEVVNLEAQNKGVERFIREARKAGVEIDLQARAIGRRLTVPLADGSFETVDVLTGVDYTITGQVGENAARTYRVSIRVGDPPNGRVESLHSDVPALAPGADVLGHFRDPSRPGRGRGR